MAFAAILLAWMATPGCDRADRAPAPEASGTQAGAGQEPAAPFARSPATSPAAAAAPAVIEPAPELPTAGIVSAPATHEGTGNALLREVRVGQRAGADRIVFEFEGSGLPAWKLEYVDRPVRDCGSGQPVPVAGDGWLEVSFTGAQAHTEAGSPTSGPRRREIDQPVLRELVRTCDFEGHVTWVAGVASPNRFTPRVHSNPARLVIDVSH